MRTMRTPSYQEVENGNGEGDADADAADADGARGAQEDTAGLTGKTLVAQFLRSQEGGGGGRKKKEVSEEKCDRAEEWELGGRVWRRERGPWGFHPPDPGSKGRSWLKCSLVVQKKPRRINVLGDGRRSRFHGCRNGFMNSVGSYRLCQVCDRLSIVGGEALVHRQPATQWREEAGLLHSFI